MFTAPHEVRPRVSVYLLLPARRSHDLSADAYCSQLLKIGVDRCLQHEVSSIAQSVQTTELVSTGRFCA